MSAPTSFVRLLVLRVRTCGRLRAPSHVHVARGTRISAAHGAVVTLGVGTRLGPDCRIDAAAGARVQIGDSARLGADSRIDARAGAQVTLGAGAWLGERALIVARAQVAVGAAGVVGDWAALVDAAPAWSDAPAGPAPAPRTVAPVRVGARARVGAHAVFEAGARLADDAIVAPYTVLGGSTDAPSSRPETTHHQGVVTHKVSDTQSYASQTERQRGL